MKRTIIYTLLFLLIIVPVIAVSHSSLTLEEKQAYREYFNRTDLNESEDTFIDRVRSQIKHESYDETLCGFERFRNTTLINVSDDLGNWTLRNNTGTYNIMVCTRNNESQEDYAVRVRQEEVVNVVRAWKDDNERMIR